jgi:RimJ/RimL family protein N-acetyltransferase
MEVREFHPYDLEALRVPVFTPRLGGATLTQHAMALKESGECFTATVNGQAIASIGLIQWWPGRRYVWAYLSDDFCAHALSLTRAIHRWLKYHGDGRIETAIDPRDPRAIRWAERFGFKCEGLMVKYLENGQDMYLYSRVR